MSHTDEAKGRVKEALGDLTDNEKLKKEGRTDRARGQVSLDIPLETAE
jgi:uncharacterized protein YjbJ (UPF0337 family)